MFDLIEECYNPQRCYSILDHLPPINYEESHSATTECRNPTPLLNRGRLNGVFSPIYTLYIISALQLPSNSD